MTWIQTDRRLIRNIFRRRDQPLQTWPSDALIHNLIYSSLEMADDSDFISRKNPGKGAMDGISQDGVKKRPLSGNDSKKLMDLCIDSRRAIPRHDMRSDNCPHQWGACRRSCRKHIQTRPGRHTPCLCRAVVWFAGIQIKFCGVIHNRNKRFRGVIKNVKIRNNGCKQ